ncbi:sensor histidine kinase [Herbinix luporum]|uniref:sensor histidine kinase n=1 Tax=Herbinix luporum TaxID=1679721 RepID=UPI00176CECFD|nr:histidine kinase [Herbinix luporum]HHT57446.1 histidine kinase [Herbinix luporum]
MKKSRQWFKRQKLNIKFTILIGMIIFIPVCGIFSLIFHNLKDNNSKQAISNLKYTMTQIHGVVQKTVELCNTSTQVFLNYQKLSEFLLLLERKETLETIDLLEFKDDIEILENIVNSNPYLYQIRVYAKTNDFPEIYPILFHHKRMEEFDWYSTYQSGQWQFDYTDVMSYNSVNTSEHTMGLITNLNDYEYGDIAVIEVAVRMEEVFDSIFQSSNQEWCGFVDKEGRIYSGCEEECIWESHKEELIRQILNHGKGNDVDEQYFETKLLNKKVVVGILPIEELEGNFVRIVSMEDSIKNVWKNQILFMIGLVFAFLCLVALINIVVKALLKRFYYILDTISKIQDGDLSLRINRYGSDEMGQLGHEIDIMLDTIERWMNENLARELLMKNSEIKALQNQINVHFIYNVLESIKMMAEIDEKYEISDAVTSLGKLLRYGMKFSSKNVTVEQEIEYIRNYLDLINLRFDFEIILAINIPQFIYKQEIPKMTLQPIVENAIYHGIEELAEDSSIYIKGYVEGEDILIEITDSGKGMNQATIEQLQKKIAGEIESGGGSGNGIGLKNVQDRIRISFGPRYGISLYSKEHCYTKVVVRLPITNREVKGNE